MVVIAKSRLFSVIMLGVVGYSVSVLFVFFKAPDLALTQFVVESISRYSYYVSIIYLI